MSVPVESPEQSEFLQSLPQLYTAPARLGPLAVRRRQARSGDAITIVPCAAASIPVRAAVLRGRVAEERDAWPAAGTWQEGDRVIVAVPADPSSRAAYVQWLASLDPPSGCSLAPCCADEGALHRLWCVAAARVILAESVGVEARHDLLGIRLAQLSLGMGADVLAGPVEADRVLPLAGVPRPTESTRAGLHALIEHAGLRAHWRADTRS